MNIELGDLKEDTYRDVTADEYKTLLSMLEGSKN
jgi:23S rRNA pseudouridine2604 synthase